MTSPGISDFLLARFDEDEAVARAASPGPWFTTGPEVRSKDGDTLVVKFTWPQESQHITRHDPARVLAECEAKRRIVETVELARHELPGVVAVWEYMLRLLALPYADHPDYRDEWRP